MIDFSIKKFFFDRDRVLKQLTAGEAKGLNLIGAVIAKIARRSIRPAGKRTPSAAPGRPPKSHVGTLRNFIFYGFDEANKSVVAGPVAVTYLTKTVVPAGGATTPGLLERGGRARRVTKRGRTIRSLHYAPHPYMQPALVKSVGSVSRILGDTIARG